MELQNKKLLEELKIVAKEFGEYLNGYRVVLPSPNEISPFIAYSLIINGWSMRLLKLEDETLQKPIMTKIEKPEVYGFSGTDWQSVKDNPPSSNSYICVKQTADEFKFDYQWIASKITGKVIDHENGNQYLIHANIEEGYQNVKTTKTLLQTFKFWKPATMQEIQYFVATETEGFERVGDPLPIEVGHTCVSRNGYPVTIVARHPNIALNGSFPLIGTWNEEKKPCVALFAENGQCQGNNHQNDLIGNREY